MFAGGSPRNPPEAAEGSDLLTCVYSRVKKTWSTRDKYFGGKFVGRRVEGALKLCSRVVGAQSLEQLDEWTMSAAKAADNTINETVAGVLEARNSGRGIFSLLRMGFRNALVKEGDRKYAPKGFFVAVLGMVASLLPARFLATPQANSNATATRELENAAPGNESDVSGRGQDGGNAQPAGNVGADSDTYGQQTMVLNERSFSPEQPEDNELNDSNSNALNNTVSLFSEDGESLVTINTQDRLHVIEQDTNTDAGNDDTQDMLDDDEKRELPDSDDESADLMLFEDALEASCEEDNCAGEGVEDEVIFTEEGGGGLGVPAGLSEEDETAMEAIDEAMAGEWMAELEEQARVIQDAAEEFFAEAEARCEQDEQDEQEEQEGDAVLYPAPEPTPASAPVHEQRAAEVEEGGKENVEPEEGRVWQRSTPVRASRLEAKLAAARARNGLPLTSSPRKPAVMAVGPEQVAAIAGGVPDSPPLLDALPLEDQRLAHELAAVAASIRSPEVAAECAASLGTEAV